MEACDDGSFLPDLWFGRLTQTQGASPGRGARLAQARSPEREPAVHSAQMTNASMAMSTMAHNG